MLQASLTLVQQGLTGLSFLSQLPRLEQLRICQPSFEMPGLDPIACLTSLKRCASCAITSCCVPTFSSCLHLSLRRPHAACATAQPGSAAGGL